MIPIRDKKTDIASEIAQGKQLQKKIVSLAGEAAEQSLSSNQTLNQIIADISKRERFNRLQIQRLVEESNTIAYNKRYDKLRASNDRRITFPIASLTEVIEEMGFSAPPEMNNPNLPVGGPGEGEMQKAASVQVETSPIHTPHSNVKERHEKYMNKVAAVQKKQDERAKSLQEKEKQSTLFKIANTIVMSEKQYKNGNEVFNTLLSDVAFSDEDKDALVKKASTIAEHMVKTKRSRPNFVVTLSEDPTEKVASHLLGEYSLLKEADDTTKVKPVKVQPTVDVSDFSALVNLARKLEAESQQGALVKQPVTTGSEVK
ncbi:hypothetical protein [Priestia megaterium]|uniref:hypothetical protein n=1 Tax=Priestia megaterium TaxID=1404 RepID=UPI000BFD2DCB|nr:hypothetical protein [Priestia megaterium]PGQ88201.1 hypothetical protein COA18_04555 [Priestia megaterium]